MLPLEGSAIAPASNCGRLPADQKQALLSNGIIKGITVTDAAAGGFNFATTATGTATPSSISALTTYAALSTTGANELARTSRLTAWIDNSSIADGHQLYLHSFIIHQPASGPMIQQGMNEADDLARRYRWHSATVRDFVSDPYI